MVVQTEFRALYRDFGPETPRSMYTLTAFNIGSELCLWVRTVRKENVFSARNRTAPGMLDWKIVYLLSFIINLPN